MFSFSGLVAFYLIIGGWLTPNAPPVADGKQIAQPMFGQPDLFRRADKADVQRIQNSVQRFRECCPHHLQVVAVSAPDDAATVVLIVSEPPPDVLYKTIQGVFGPSIRTGLIIKHPDGPDGFYCDVAFVLSAPAPEVLARQIHELHRVLFGTAHGAEALRLDQLAPQKFQPGAFDLSVNPADLNQWMLVDTNLMITAVTGGEPTSFAKRFSLGTMAQPAVYHVTSELVAWIVPRGVDFKHLRIPAREFGVEADIILGAIANSENVAIIGRRRQVTLAELPPLRFEGMLALAISCDEVYQSFERTDIFAGKRRDKYDWCKSVLSNGLIDTEPGALAIRTDTYLKGRSMAGRVFYPNFPKRRVTTFPFGPKSITTLMPGTGLTFNFHSNGMTTLSELSDHQILAVQSTGAFRVRYIPTGSPVNPGVQKYEDTAHHYFADLNDPDLVRTAAYGQVLQLFRTFDIGTDTTVPNECQWGQRSLNRDIQSALNALARLNERDRKSIVHEFVANFPEAERPEMESAIDSWLTDLAAVRSENGAAGIKELAEVVAAPRHSKPLETANANNMSLALRLKSDPNLSDFVKRLLDLDGVCTNFASAMSNRPSRNRWARTATFILSQKHNFFGPAVMFSGGHTFSNEATPIELDPSVPRGQEVRGYDLQGHRVIRKNPLDVPAARKAAEILKGNQDAARDRIPAESNVPPQNRAPLGLAASDRNSRRPIRGLNEAQTAQLDQSVENARGIPTFHAVRIGTEDRFALTIDGTNVSLEATSVGMVEILFAVRLRYAAQPPPVIVLSHETFNAAYNLKLTYHSKALRAGVEPDLIVLVPAHPTANPDFVIKRAALIAQYMDSFGDRPVIFGKLESGREDPQGKTARSFWRIELSRAPEEVNAKPVKLRLSAYLKRNHRFTPWHVADAAVKMVYGWIIRGPRSVRQAVTDFSNELKVLGLDVELTPVLEGETNPALTSPYDFTVVKVWNQHANNDQSVANASKQEANDESSV